MPLNRPSPPVTACPVERAIHVIGGKWKLLVLRALLLDGPRGYNQLLAALSGISAKELTRNLNELEKSGLVQRETGALLRSRSYSLTPAGEGLMPVFTNLLSWGQTLLPGGATNISVR